MVPMADRSITSESMASPRTSPANAAATRDGVALGRAEVRRAARYSLKIFLVARVGLTVLSLAAVGLVTPNPPTEVPGWPAPEPQGGFDNVGTSFERWDALWFLRIADEG